MSISLLKLSGVKEDVKEAEKATDTNPSPAQIEAGNYAKGKVTVRGLTISIENPKGSTRRGTDKNGKAWETTLKNSYGYFLKTEACDGDHVDTFIGPDPEHGKIWVVDQYVAGKYDEPKVMFGFQDEESARSAYLANYQSGWKGLHRVTRMDDDKFKEWLAEGAPECKDKSAAIDKVKALSEAGIPRDVIFYTGPNGRATACLGDWHSKEICEAANRIGHKLFPNFEEADDTEIGRPEWSDNDIRSKATAKQILENIPHKCVETTCQCCGKTWKSCKELVHNEEDLAQHEAEKKVTVTQCRSCEMAALEKAAVVEKVGDKWVLWTKDKKRRLGTHDTARQAYAQEYAIQKSEEAANSKQATDPSYYDPINPSIARAVAAMLDVPCEKCRQQDKSASLDIMHKARTESDKGRYARKSLVLRQLIDANPGDWMVDSIQGRFVGITHVPSGFQFHLPANHVSQTLGSKVPDLDLKGKTTYNKPMKSAYDAYQRHNVQSMLPISERRELTPEEHERVFYGKGRFIPKIFENLSDDPTVRMASPGVAATLWGTGVGVPAMMLFGRDSLGGKAVGAGLGGLAALVAYLKRQQKNTDIEETMRRLPEGATLRDFEADPLMAERRRMKALTTRSSVTPGALGYLLGKQSAYASRREELIRQGSCCGNACRDCPYEPRHTLGATKVLEKKAGFGSDLVVGPTSRRESAQAERWAKELGYEAPTELSSPGRHALMKVISRGLLGALAGAGVGRLVGYKTAPVPIGIGATLGAASGALSSALDRRSAYNIAKELQANPNADWLNYLDKTVIKERTLPTRGQSILAKEDAHTAMERRVLERLQRQWLEDSLNQAIRKSEGSGWISMGDLPAESKKRKQAGTPDPYAPKPEKTLGQQAAGVASATTDFVRDGYQSAGSVMSKLPKPAGTVTHPSMWRNPIQAAKTVPSRLKNIPSAVKSIPSKMIPTGVGTATQGAKTLGRVLGRGGGGAAVGIGSAAITGALTAGAIGAEKYHQSQSKTPIYYNDPLEGVDMGEEMRKKFGVGNPGNTAIGNFMRSVVAEPAGWGASVSKAGLRFYDSLDRDNYGGTDQAATPEERAYNTQLEEYGNLRRMLDKNMQKSRSNPNWIQERFAGRPDSERMQYESYRANMLRNYQNRYQDLERKLFGPQGNQPEQLP